MYRLKTTGEVYKLDHVENVPSSQKDIRVYVFENGQRWAEDLFFKYFEKMPSTEEMKFDIYKKGLSFMCVCVPKEMSCEEIERRANQENPPGPDYAWRITKDTTFNYGEPMPFTCQSDENCLHWLLNLVTEDGTRVILQKR